MRDIFDLERLPPAVDAFLRDSNPWWTNSAGPPLPPYRRWAFGAIQRRLDSGLAPIVVVRGPRQVGKTTIQQQIILDLLRNRNVPPTHVIRVQFDDLPSLRGIADPMLALTRWYESRILGKSCNQAAQDGQPVWLFFDEVQNQRDWAPQLKSLVDGRAVKVLVTGSSALRIEAGRDSLAGRITQVELGTLLLREIAGLQGNADVPSLLGDNGLDKLLRTDFWEEAQSFGVRHRVARDQAFAAFSARGGYPLAHAHPDIAWPEIADQLNETVIKRAIQHDLRMGEQGRKRDPQLLEEVYRLACRYAGQAPGQAVYVSSIQQTLNANVGWQRVLTYLRFLDGAMLLRLVEPLEIRLKKRKGNAKLCLCDHGLRASWLQEVIPIDPAALQLAPHLADLAGRIVESAVGYFLSGIPHLDVAHFPERGAEPEVDFILTIGEKRIPLEVKYRSKIDPHRDTLGLQTFLEKSVYGAPFGILVSMNDNVTVPDPRIRCISLPSLLWTR
ncbi:MAG: AAA family ATPase [Geminicoccaceae bacterium]